MTHFSMIQKLAHAAALVAALVAAFGAALGFYHMTNSIPIAAAAGIGIASILALGWHALITAAGRTRRVSAQAMILTLGVLLVGLALATSGWALATAIGGSSAMGIHNRAQIEAHQDALITAVERVTAQKNVLDAVATGEAAYRGYAEAEASGDLGGGSGCGPNCRAYQRQADVLSGVMAQLSGQMDEGARIYSDALDSLSAARRLDDPAPALIDVATAVADLNAIDLDTSGVGMIQYTAGASGLTVTGQDQLTAAMTAADADVLPAPAVPAYEVITPADATWRYASSVAGAWIAAFGIDVAPFLMMLLVLTLALEPLLREERNPRKPTTDDQIRSREEDVQGLRVVAGE